MDLIQEMRTQVSAISARSYFDKAAKQYALEILDEYEAAVEYHERHARGYEEFSKWLLNGARDWYEYSNGANALVSDAEIAERIATPSELRRTNGGELKPTAFRSWVSMQAACLVKASGMVRQARSKVIRLYPEASVLLKS